MKKHQKVRREDDALVIQKRNSFRRNSSPWRKALAWAVTAWTLGMATAAYASDAALPVPVPGAKDAAVSIVTSGNVMDITSTADNNLIKWADFSVGSGRTVDFHDKNYLNYVTGSAVSDIYGTLAGTGSIYLVNPNGILIHDNAVINVGSLHLSTKQLDAAALTSYDTGMTALSSASIAGGDVINMGRLNATSITVEGNNITFKNTADVTKGGSLGADGKITGGTAHTEANSVSLTAGAEGEIHLGFAVGDEATAVNDTQYTGVTLPDPTGWTFGGKEPVKYMLVRNAYELQNMKNNYWQSTGAYYMLAQDIDMKDFVNFTPIGPSSGSTFSGRFDGLNHQIQNLTINLPSTDNVGLFGGVAKKGVVENVGLVGGSVTGSSYVGGIAGENRGTIRNVYNTGTVSGQGNDVGGIVGKNSGTIRNVYNTGTVSGQGHYVGGIVGTNSGTVERAYNTGNVTGTKLDVGGIVGNNSGTVERAYNTGDVTGKSEEVGGIVGNMTDAGKVNNAYNTGEVEGKYSVGGIVGYMKCNNSDTSGVFNVYNTGSVTATEKDSGGRAYVGGIIGDLEQGKRTNVYTKSGMVSAPDRADYVDDRIGNRERLFDLSGNPSYAGVVIENEDDLKQAETFDGFDFKESGPWRIYEGKTTPFLAAFPIPEPADPDPGTDPTNPGTTDPANPGTTDPTNPGTTDPSNPGTDPTNPGTTNPTNPGTTDPTNPGTTNPTNPGTDPTNPGTDPTNPGTDPTNPGTDPTNPGTDPTNPGTDPTNPGTTNPTNPGTTSPTNPGTTNPSNPGTTDPTNPGTTDPTNPGTTDPTNPLNPTNPVSAGDPTPQLEQKPQDIVKNVTENRGAAQEYTNVVGSINSGASTAMPTSGGTPVLNAPEAPTQNAAPTTGATGETQGAAAQKQSGGEAQQPNENPPQQQTTGGQIAAGKQETQLGITYTDINMPESMSVEALATSLNGGATATTPNNAGGEATQNGPATEPTTTTGGNMSGANEEDEA